MPQPSQTRIARIKELVEWGKGKNTMNIDILFAEARDRFPFARKVTVMNYAQVALRILKRSDKG